MRIHTVRWAVCGVLALGLCLLAGQSGRTADDDKAAIAAAPPAFAVVLAIDVSTATMWLRGSGIRTRCWIVSSVMWS